MIDFIRVSLAVALFVTNIDKQSVGSSIIEALVNSNSNSSAMDKSLFNKHETKPKRSTFEYNSSLADSASGKLHTFNDYQAL